VGEQNAAVNRDIQPGPDGFKHRIDQISNRLKSWDEDRVRLLFGLPGNSRLLKTTISLCQDCLVHVPAAVYEQDDKVFISSRCDIHGTQVALIENDARFYRLSSKDRWGVRYAGDNIVDLPAYSGCCSGAGKHAGAPVDHSWPADFTDQRANKSCTVLVEITNACNLACRVCYADSRGDRVLPFGKFKTYLKHLIEQKGFLDSVQLTGGEASLHPQFWDMLEWLHRQTGVGKIYLPTNGIEFSKPSCASRLRPFRDKVLVLLQFDGLQASTNQSLRRSQPLKPRLRLVKALNRNGIVMQFTMTLARDVSEHEIAWVVKQAVKYKNVRVLGILPAFFSGRYELDAHPRNRLTLSDAVNGVVAGLPGSVRKSDFLPIPCSHPNCGWTTLFARRFGLLFNIARFVNLEAVMDDVAYKTILDKKEMQGIIGTRTANWCSRLLARMGRRLIRPRDVFGIAIKPFMDRYSYDQDRVSACCHHILDTQGRLASFCEYNARLREGDGWDRQPRIHRSSNELPVEVGEHG
jgi:7,8-dihydro-6-hydroxymethylpterin dimethyltransferase